MNPVTAPQVTRDEASVQGGLPVPDAPSPVTEPGTGGDLLDVRLDCFEGPVDLLLDLLRTRRLEVDEVSVSKIVDDFVAIVQQASGVDLEAESKFLLVASTLLQLKTRRLLPVDEELEIDEDLLVDAERDTLLSRLLTARTFADVADVLRDRLHEGARYVPRVVQPEAHVRRPAPDLRAQLSALDLASVAAEVLARSTEELPLLDHLVPAKASVRDALDELRATLHGSGPASFVELCRGKTRIQVIVRFLAVLELLKAGFVGVDQHAPLTDMTVTWVAPEDAPFDIVLSGWDADHEDATTGGATTADGEGGPDGDGGGHAGSDSGEARR